MKLKHRYVVLLVTANLGLLSPSMSEAAVLAGSFDKNRPANHDVPTAPGFKSAAGALLVGGLIWLAIIRLRRKPI